MEKKPKPKLPPRAQAAADISRRLVRWSERRGKEKKAQRPADDSDASAYTIVEPSPAYLVPVPQQNPSKKRLVADGTLDSASTPIKTITIMADFGHAYAWIKDASDESEEVGGNIADAVGGFGDEYGVPAELEKQFAAWVIRFEREHENPAFDWDAFHRDGIALCRRLKQVLGDAYRVVYTKSREDPNYGMNRKAEIF